MMPLLGSVLALAVVIIAGGSLRRKGRIGTGTYAVIVGVMTVILAATALLLYRSGSLVA